MPENETIRKQIVSIDVDTAASKRVKQHVQELKRELAGLKASTAQMNTGFVETGRQSTQVAQMTKEVTRLKAETRGAAEETKRLGQAEKTVAQHRSSQSLRQVETSVRGITSPIAMMGGGDLVRPINMGADLFGAAEGVKILKRDLGDMTNQMGISATQAGVLGLAIAAAMAVIVLVADEINDSAKRARAAVVAQIEAVQAFNKESFQATSETAQKRLQQLEEERTIQRQNLTDFQQIKAGLDKAMDASDGNLIDQAASLFVRAADGLGLLKIGTDDAEAAITQAQEALDANSVATNLWTDYLGSATAALWDSYAATQAAIKARAADAKGYVDSMMFIRESTKLTTEQVDERLASLRAERDAIVQSDKSLQLFAKGALTLEQLPAAFQPMAERLQAVTGQIQDLTNSTVQQAAALNTNRKFAEDFTKALDKNQAAFASYQQEVERTTAQRLTQSIREEEDAARQRTNAIAQHYQDLAQLDEQTAERRADILTDIADATADTEKDRLKTLREANQEAIQDAREHRQRLIDIQRGTNADIRKAALHLDAVGIWEAQKAGQEALRQEDDQYQEEKRQRDADTRDRLREIREQRDDKIRAGKQALRDLDQQHAKEREAKIRAFQQQQSREDQERAIRLQRQQQDWAREDLLRQQNFLAQAGATDTHYKDLQGRTITGMLNIASAFSAGLSSLAVMAQQQLAAPPASSYHTGGSRYTPSAYATGTPRTRADEWAWTGEGGPELVRFMQPSRVYNHADSMRMMRPSLSIGDIIVQGGGAPRETAMAVRDEVLRVMYEFYQGKRN